MTLSKYIADVTEAILQTYGPDFVFPEWFETDIGVYFRMKLKPGAAVARILSDMASIDSKGV